VTLTETVPENTTFVATGSTAGWSCPDASAAGTRCTMDIGALRAGASGSAMFRAKVNQPLAPGIDGVSNTVSIADDGTHGAATGSHVATTSTTVGGSRT